MSGKGKPNLNTRFIFVTGGVCSSLGKGVTVASIGALLEARGYTVGLQKMDPYLNVDPGTMSPFQHGEVYVTDDGAETDLDLGYYERYTSSRLTKTNSVSTGQIYYNVITRERRGDYLGRTVQVVPHITNEIKHRVWEVARQDNPDFVIVEIGGTVGDIESVPFIEAIRQFRHDHADSVIYVHLTLVPTIRVSGEVKTKPTQHSVKELSSLGIQPDILICRMEEPLPEDMKNKISLFTNVAAENVISARDIDTTIYEIPLMYLEEKLDVQILRHFDLEPPRLNFRDWKSMVNTVKSAEKEVTIAVVGKYIQLSDAYRSVYEAISHGAIAARCKVNIRKIDAEKVTSGNIKSLMKDVDGLLVPGGFGERGTQGKIQMIRHARENKIPYLGICLGMQLAVVEFARHILGWKGANSTEFNENATHPVISLLQEQKDIDQLGGTQRLGAYPCTLAKDTLAHSLYKKTSISERHRHRFEFTQRYREDFEKGGLVISGVNTEHNLVEVVELPDHPFFIGCQFHPEFQSKPTKVHPLFAGLLKAAFQKKFKGKATS